MIPIRDDNPTRRRAWVTLMLIVLNVGVYFLLQPHDGKSVITLPEPESAVPFNPGFEQERFTFAYAAIPCELVKGRPLLVQEVVATERGSEDTCGASTFRGDARELFPAKNPYLGIVLSMFLHGGLLHLGGNMLFLWIFGNNIEDRWGRIGYLAFYLLGGVAATAAHVVVGASSTVPVIGASGAIAAVMGAYLVLYPNVRITTVFTFLLFFTTRISAKWLLVFWFVSQFFVSSGSGVAWVAHVGGFVFGMAVALVALGLGRARRVPAGMR